LRAYLAVMTKLTEDRIGALVDAFYARVREDEVLGPVFDGAVDDWAEHLEKLTAFWSSVMLGAGTFRGNPMQAHLRHKAAIAPAMFERWLGLWRQTAVEHLSEGEAAAVIARAERIAESLQLGLFFRIDRAPDRPAAA
jgi:hemoglobin